MNKTAIKNFAIWVRVQLIESAKQRAFEYEITENGENSVNIESIGGRLLSKDEKEQRGQLIAKIHQKGYTQVMEEAAYTWFNRFIALRFMEVNGYLPSKIRVFTDENGTFKPDILKQAMSVELDGLDRKKVLKLLDAQANEELYKYLLITQCNALNAALPEMFEKLGSYTEMLLPNNILKPDSVLGRLVTDIPEEDWKDAVQIIGWMY
ncbi:MAG: SAM-dependent methyltransferase, partial [Clostridiales bacterium]|nr:SAM-dependent methyltransferase [Clostridiales bacterium]